jgi:ATP-binding cassette subfamily B protein
MLQGAIPFATSVVKVLVLVYVVARLDIVLAGVALLGGPAFFAVTELFRRRLRRRWTEVREQESLAMAVAQEVLASVRVVKAFGQEAREGGRYWKRERAGVRATMRATWVHGIFDVVIVTAQGLAGAAILYLGALHVQQGVITLGELLLVLAYLAQLMQPMMDAGTRIAELQKSLASAGRAFALLDETPETTERPGARSLTRAKGAFELRDMSFGYRPDDPLFSDVSLEIPAGARVGIAGETGSGKSTLLGLLPRFYDPTSGAILLDGADLRDIRLSDLRRQFAMVLQDSVLFSTTIRENIAYGRPEATEAEIVQAAKDAAAHDFITAKPDGYETKVGERGSTLSGGERQRIAIARAFLCDAPVLILDEPTSALDTGTEAEVMAAVERLMEGRTTFVIAHRLSTLEACDIRLQVGDGRVEVR